ncbi:MAG: hypothetical protein U0T75_00035 [Chitinophagales bacterium]
MKKSRLIYKKVNEWQFLILKGEIDRLVSRIKPYLKKNSLYHVVDPVYGDYMLDIIIAFERSGFKGRIYIGFKDIKNEDLYQIAVQKYYITRPPYTTVQAIVKDDLRWGEFRDHAIDYISKCIEEYDMLQL